MDHRTASSTQVTYQPTVAGSRRSLKVGTAISCRSPEAVLRRAERIYQGGSIFRAQVRVPVNAVMGLHRDWFPGWV